MDRQEILKTIADIIADIMEIDADEITEDTTFDSISADSLAKVELVCAMEDEFNVEVDDSKLGDITSVHDVIDLLVQTLG